MTTVLIVDDSAVDCKRAEKLLTKGSQLTVLSASNGRQALELMKDHQPDLIITDMQMPEMDGLQLVEEVRCKYPGIPVILMTAHGSEELAVQALQKGAASYVSWNVWSARNPISFWRTMPRSSLHSSATWKTTSRA